MKLLQYFNNFLRDAVNLNKTRIERIEDGKKTIEKFLKNNDIFSELFLELIPQGSYRQETIIKPCPKKEEFDVDLLFLLEQNQEWEPKDYLNELYNQFKNSERYEDIVDRVGKARCVTLDYESDFHIDIVPCIKIDGEYRIMNKNENSYEKTDGDGYAEWFTKKDKITQNKNLVKSVRLFKYLRDYKQTFSVKSILLTTLLGERVKENDEYETEYTDLPTTLKTLFNRLNDYLDSNSTMPEICNPVLKNEKFDRHWDEDKYENFRNMIKTYNEKFNEAYNSVDAMESAKKYQEIFGDKFPFPPKKNKIAEFFSSIFIEPFRSKNEEKMEDYSIIEDIGSEYKFSIDGKVLKNDEYIEYLLSEKDYHVVKGREIEFFVKDDNIPYEYRTLWKVRNRGVEAKEKGQLRGEMTWDNTLRVPEHTAFSGGHYVECYAVVEDKICIAKDKIDVIID